MQIKALGEDKIRVDLSDDDLALFDVTYDELDYNDVKTRRVIWTLLDEAEKELGLLFDTKKKLVVEVCRKAPGGCTVFFTLLKNSEASSQIDLKRECETVVFEAFDENAFIDAALILKKLKIPSSKSALLKGEGRFFAVIYLPSKNADCALHILSEFGKASLEGEAYALKLLESCVTVADYSF